MFVSSDSLKAEESRIQQVYGRRRSDLYSRFNPAQLFVMQEREQRFLKLLLSHRCTPLETKKILEIGCGTGDLLRDFVNWGARPENVTGIDVLPDRVAEAIRLCPGEMRIQRSNAANLEFSSEQFDVVVQSTVFTSVLESQIKRQIASEMLRVVKPGGLIFWYDYHVNNPRNPDVRGVKRREIYGLFPNCRIQLQRITLAPPIARLVAPYSWLLCYFMQKIPLLCTHYIGVIRKKEKC
ncbi:MAG: class I SAM-dependent methyltransferase [Gammaproteobacteria bacterium]